MALKLKFQVSQISQDCNCFYLTDTTGDYSATNTGGYGSPNIEVSDVDQWSVTLTDANGNRWISIWDTVVAQYPNSQRICASQFQAIGAVSVATQPECTACNQAAGMPATTPDSGIMDILASGCYQVEYAIYTKLPYSCEECTYDIKVKQKSVTLGDNIWLRINGVWVDMMSYFVSYSDTAGMVWRYQATTCDEITAYQIRNINGVAETSVPVSGTGCTTVTVTPTDPVLYTSKTLQAVFTCKESDRLSQLVLSIAGDGCIDCYKADNPVPCQLMMAKSFLEAAQGAGCNCTCANGLVRQVGQILSKVENFCQQ